MDKHSALRMFFAIFWNSEKMETSEAKDLEMCIKICDWGFCMVSGEALNVFYTVLSEGDPHFDVMLMCDCDVFLRSKIYI